MDTPDGPNLERDVQRILELMEHVQKTGEVNNPKLASLQQVLQSEFFGAVREVYETVYDSTDADTTPTVSEKTKKKSQF